MTYKIETNVKPRPKFKYPFDDLEIDESFVVPSTDQRPKPWKQMGSTILWANRRFAPKSFRIQKSDEPLGARIWRIDDQAVKGQTEAPKPEPVKVKPKPKPVEVKPEPVEVKSTEVEMASVTELNECVELTRCSYDKMIARMNQAIDDYTEGVVTEHLHIIYRNAGTRDDSTELISNESHRIKVYAQLETLFPAKNLKETMITRT